MSSARLKPIIPPEPPLTQEERHHWRKAYRAALKGMLAAHNGKLASLGVGHLAGGHADDAIYEERRRFGAPQS